MPNPYFRFRQFSVYHDKCAMKVGTDGVLIGAWANGGKRILDVGTGSGLIALMMAQRFPQAKIDAVDIDSSACQQAMENVANSPFAHQVEVRCMAVQNLADNEEFQGIYDAVVCNPPFFENALKAPVETRSMARHNDTLPFKQLFSSVAKLMDTHGAFSLIIPSEYKGRIMEEAALAGFFNIRECAVKTTPKKSPRRFLLEFSLVSTHELFKEEQLLEISHGHRSPWYEKLTQDFYL